MNIRFKTSITAGLVAISMGAALAEQFATTKSSPRDDWWMKRHAEKLQEIKDKGEEIDLVFIGDSITHSMDDRAAGLVQETFPGITHLNLGYSADRTENVLWRLKNGEIDGISPDLVVLMIGTNNTGHRKDPAEETFGGIKLIVEEIRQKLPESRVLVLSIFPRSEHTSDPLRQLNDKINALLPQLADGKHVHHLDINSEFLAADGSLSKEIMPDLLHPNRRGYEIWLKAIQNKAQELMVSE